MEEPLTTRTGLIYLPLWSQQFLIYFLLSVCGRSSPAPLVTAPLSRVKNIGVLLSGVSEIAPPVSTVEEALVAMQRPKRTK